MIHADDIQRVKAEADAVAIIGGYIRLRRSGSTHRGPCPFHQGKHDNLSVRGNYFRCFVCNEQGDLFTFLQKHLGLDFIGAVRLAAETTGITLRETTTDSPNDQRAKLWEANEAARELFEHHLHEVTFFGCDAQRYLVEERGLSLDDARRFQLGWAPHSTTGWMAKLSAMYDQRTLLDAGLLVDKNGDGKVKGRFWDRLIFPVRDIGGRLAGFAGRRIDNGEPKYLNSPDSPTFNKGELLYNLDQAKPSIRKAGRILIVEGYMDVIRLVLAGIGEVVAPMGTAMTPAQAKLIRRFSPTAFLLYDRDAAGLKATFRNARMLLAAGVTVRVVTLPVGHDPDSFTRVYGRDAMEEEIMASIDVFERQVELLNVGGYLDNIALKREAADKLVPTIAAASDPLTRDLYMGRAAEALGVSIDSLRPAVSHAIRERAKVTR